MSLKRVYRVCFLFTDIGFLLYWSMSLLMAAGVEIIDPEFMYYGYGNEFTMAWNWSFFPLDMIVSVLGLSAICIPANAGRRRLLLHLSAALTFCAGFMALCFWSFVGFFDPVWWGMNGFLSVWPVFFLAEEFRAIS